MVPPTAIGAVLERQKSTRNAEPTNDLLVIRLSPFGSPTFAPASEPLPVPFLQTVVQLACTGFRQIPRGPTEKSPVREPFVQRPRLVNLWVLRAQNCAT
jgi:hypothetical protein